MAQDGGEEPRQADGEDKGAALTGGRCIAQDRAAADEPVSFTPEMLTEIADELRQTLSETPAPQGVEEKKAVREKKQVGKIEKMRDKLSEYDDRLETLGGRNSYSKTDPSATFMRMKEDAMNNGQTKPGYNLQIATENQFIINYGLYDNRTDTLTIIPFLESFYERYGHFSNEISADSGYGSLENYAFMASRGIKAYVKYNLFHKEQTQAFKNDIFRIENLRYNPDGDYFVCPMGQHMSRVRVKCGKTESGYRTEIVVYRAKRCEGCPLRWGCHRRKKGNREIEVNHELMEYKRKARERLMSGKGLEHRSKRPIEPEAVFGQMKYNMQYKRFRHFGKDKVTMDFAFFAIAFNIKKMAAKIRKQRNMPTDGGTLGLCTASYTPVWDMQGKINRKNAKIAA